MSSDLLFADRVALITGGASGIGKTYAERFASNGAAVVVADINYPRALATAAEITSRGGQALAVELDVSVEDSVRHMYQTVIAHFGRVDFLINNAALMLYGDKPFKPFWELEQQEWDQVMAVNARGVYLCCKHVKPIMEKQGGGRIVNITSHGIWKGYEYELAYFASKGAVAVLTRCLARELGHFNVNVNSVAPGRTLSERVQASEVMQRTQAEVRASCAIQRDQYPEDVAGTVLFLCSPESACITGQTIVVDCGSVML